jgi:hypothetical protein
MADPNDLCASEALSPMGAHTEQSFHKPAETLVLPVVSSRVNDHAEQLSISSPKLQRILLHWLECRTDRLMPMWRDIRPAKIKAELPFVWQYRYEPKQDEFFGGLSGNEIQRLVGGPIKNVRFRHLHRGDPHLFPRAKRVLFNPAIFYGRGLLFNQRDRQCFGERIMLPFASADGLSAGIFGATDYSYSFLYQGEPESRCEVEHWSPLSQQPPSRALQRPPSIFSGLRPW